jgi:hypothetical protein
LRRNISFLPFLSLVVDAFAFNITEAFKIRCNNNLELEDLEDSS